MKWDFKTLCSLLARAEGGKSQVAIGDVREIVRCLGALIKEDKALLEYLYDYCLKIKPRKGKGKAMPCGTKKKPKKPKK